MASQHVKLRYRQGAPTVAVRDLTGREERLVRDASTQSAVDLLGSLMEWPAGARVDAHELTAPDRDRLLTAVYRREFGTKVDSTALCTNCSSRFDIAFHLEDLQSALDRTIESSTASALEDGTFRTATGVRFRLPTAREEIEVVQLPPEQGAYELASRCILEAPAGEPREVSMAAVESAIEEVAPVLDLNIDTACPECGAKQAVRFDMQYFLLCAIERERAQMTREVHRIASAYGWSLQEILGLERSERRVLAQWIETDLTARRRAQ